ncbi:MAG: DUF4136 domain-containing protein, partial [Pseudomonadota bacterium]
VVLLRMRAQKEDSLTIVMLSNVLPGHTVEQFTEGSISIDIFDSAVGRPVWFGHASEEVDSFISRDQARDMVLGAIPLILEPFPPEGS